MAELNEKELLLLDILMYTGLFDDSYESKTVEDVVTKYNLLKDSDQLDTLDMCGDFGMADDPEGLLDKVMTQIAADDTLTNLIITDVATDAGVGIDAACFVDPATNEATVAFQGTDASYRAWYDDFDGAGMTFSTPMQDAAASFVESLPYDSITVSGHSKGGNLAAFVTMECPNVDRCVSYDGQRLGEPYLLANMDKVNANGDKIKTISAHNDPVNTLLLGTYGEDVYVQNTGEQFMACHYATNLLFDNTYDEFGNFDSTCEQDLSLQVFDKSLDILIIAMPPDVEEYSADMIGSVASVLLGSKELSYSELLQATATFDVSALALLVHPLTPIPLRMALGPIIIAGSALLTYTIYCKNIEIAKEVIDRAKKLLDAAIIEAKAYLLELQKQIISTYETIRNEAVEIVQRYVEQVQKLMQTIKDYAALLTKAVMDITKELALAALAAVVDVEQILVTTVVNAIGEVGQCIQNLYDSVCKFINEQCNYGYQYASANSYICMDTGSLRNYAGRLESVNNRLGSVDSRLDSLYGKVSLLDLWSLLNSDLMIHRSEIVRESAAYLYSTADEFDQIENQLHFE